MKLLLKFEEALFLEYVQKTDFKDIHPNYIILNLEFNYKSNYNSQIKNKINSINKFK